MLTYYITQSCLTYRVYRLKQRSLPPQSESTVTPTEVDKRSDCKMHVCTPKDHGEQHQTNEFVIFTVGHHYMRNPATSFFRCHLMYIITFITTESRLLLHKTRQ